jgi:hypothetical protein
MRMLPGHATVRQRFFAEVTASQCSIRDRPQTCSSTTNYSRLVTFYQVWFEAWLCKTLFLGSLLLARFVQSGARIHFRRCT